MFKNVDYLGFEANPELKAKAEHATGVLANQIRTWREDVDVTWRPAMHDPKAVLELTLALSLWNASGSAAGEIRLRGFSPGEEHTLRIDLREVWLNLLGELSHQQMKRLDEALLEPAEA